jgi:ABC-type molybdenum transport system ATPase subunit/photorepair protein PhrA
MAFGRLSEHVEGLWIARNGPKGYLAKWFPRIGQPSPQFIPLTNGLNVIYGRNGSGKTQLLNAIASASAFRLSGFEGIIVKDARKYDWSLSSHSEIRTIQILSNSQETYTKYLNHEIHSAQMGGGFYGFTPEHHLGENQEIAIQIIEEFLEHNRMLLTRNTSLNPDSFPYYEEPKEMQAPKRLELVPVLMPEAEAPVSRDWAKQIRSSFIELFLELLPRCDEYYNTDGNIDEDRQEVIEEYFDERLIEWLRKWEWNPLLNRRNFPIFRDSNWVTWLNDDYRSVETLTANVLNGIGDDLLFLPEIESEDPSAEIDEFSSPKSFEALELNLETQIKTKSIGKFPLSNDFNRHLAPERKIQEAKISIRTIRDLLAFLPNFEYLSLREIFTATEDAIPSEIEYIFEFPSKFLYPSRVNLEYGSAAEIRWFDLALSAISAGRNSWMIIDEPENGLHRSAEHMLARTLNSADWKNLGNLVIATHSPEFLDVADNVLQVINGKVEEFTNVRREQLSELGLRPSDLLTNVRSFLLVEGEHERIVFENCIGDDLRSLKCQLVVARGGKNMKDIFESQILFDFTDANLFCLLDNTDTNSVKKIWSESIEKAKIDFIEAGKFIRRSLPRAQSGENRFMGEFMTKALAAGEFERVNVLGMSKADIILYLDPQFFGLSKSWDELIAEAGPNISIKEYAKIKYGADFSAHKIEEAAKSLAALPQDFILLLHSIDL